jgi:hypothetical protein
MSSRILARSGTNWNESGTNPTLRVDRQSLACLSFVNNRPWNELAGRRIIDSSGTASGIVRPVFDENSKCGDDRYSQGAHIGTKFPSSTEAMSKKCRSGTNKCRRFVEQHSKRCRRNSEAESKQGRRLVEAIREQCRRRVEEMSNKTRTQGCSFHAFVLQLEQIRNIIFHYSRDLIRTN